MEKIKKLTAKEQIEIIEFVKGRIKSGTTPFICTSIKLALHSRGIIPLSSVNSIETFKPNKYIKLCTRRNATKVCKAEDVEKPWINAIAWWRWTEKEARIVFLDWMIKELQKEL